MSKKQPDPFLEVRVSEIHWDPGLIGLCAGYERGTWRAEQLAGHLIEWIPEFALSHSERQEMNDATAVALLREAALKIYKTDKFKNRGEIGELILHAVLRQVHATYPALSKIYYKDSSNDIVKGFDAVHVVASGKELELWIGEVKYYKSINKAISDVVEELKKHTTVNFLRDEFILISDKIDPSWPFAKALKNLIHRNKSMDEIFARTVIPVLLCYESDTVKAYDQLCVQYTAAYREEIETHYKRFCGAGLPLNICLNLLLLPLHTKRNLSKSFDTRLKALQAL
jgi:hypothetical protein